MHKTITLDTKGFCDNRHQLAINKRRTKYTKITRFYVPRVPKKSYLYFNTSVKNLQIFIKFGKCVDENDLFYKFSIATRVSRQSCFSACKWVNELLLSQEKYSQKPL